jgi:hypothetical protein
MPFLLWPGQSVWARYTMKALSAGQQGAATATVDPNNRCRETSERNNTMLSPVVQVIERPRLKLAVHRPATAPPISPTEVFPITITNVGRGVATDVAVSWSPSLTDLDPVLISATGPPFAQGSNAPTPLTFTCPDQAGMCIIQVRLGPNEAIEGRVRFAACRNRSNATLHVSTADDVAVDDHSVPLHRACGG